MNTRTNLILFFPVVGDTDRAGPKGLPPPGGGCGPLTDHPPPEAPRDHAGTDCQHEGLVWNVRPVSSPSHKPCHWKCTYGDSMIPPYIQQYILGYYFFLSKNNQGKVYKSNEKYKSFWFVNLR